MVLVVLVVLVVLAELVVLVDRVITVAGSHPPQHEDASVPWTCAGSRTFNSKLERRGRSGGGTDCCLGLVFHR